MSKETAINFKKSLIPELFATNIRENENTRWNELRTESFYVVVFTTFAKALAAKRCGKHDTGFIFKDDKGNFKFGGILTYQNPEEGSEDDTGNFYLSFTDNSDDFKDFDPNYLIDNHNNMFVDIAKTVALDVMHGRFQSVESMNLMFNTAIDTLYVYMDKNVNNEDDVHELTLDGIFTAIATIDENGNKIISIVPGDFIKQLIKDDRAISI